MNIWDILLLAALILVLGLAVRRVVRARGKSCGCSGSGCSGCGGSCGACPHACACRGGKSAP